MKLSPKAFESCGCPSIPAMVLLTLPPPRTVNLLVERRRPSLWSAEKGCQPRPKLSNVEIRSRDQQGIDPIETSSAQSSWELGGGRGGREPK